MAKHDFCFTYYDGDAARDMAHMNRLERGAYSDLIVSQRKFGRLSMALIKKTLGNDFNDVWDALEVVLLIEEDKYFIEWLDTSVKKMQKQSGHQSDNGKLGGRPKKTQTKANDNPNESQTPLEKKPLGNGYGNEEELKGGMGEKEIIPQMQKAWKLKNKNYPADKQKDSPALLSIAKFICGQEEILFNPVDIKCVNTVLGSWEHLCDHIPKHDWFKNYNLSQIDKHIQAIVLDIQNGKSINSKSTADEKFDARVAYANRYNPNSVTG